MPTKSMPHRGFTFVEAVFTIAIIGIMAALAISAISNGARDASRIVARQQQAAVQEALNAWILSQTRVRTSTGLDTVKVQSIEAVRVLYNALPSTSARFQKLKPDLTSSDPSRRAGYLDSATVLHFEEFSVGTDRLKTSAMEGSRQYLTLPNWQADSEPKVELVDE